eukprot:TRINITY_DN309_c0_g2_i1.p1 TRINITY_DN309_c0_g2~~TRINITY_DN309_c0_g2_i1.p1  ORF type:complete len:522 (-),score=229.38 TRINITY_DN309_c0_g2_i1:168-1733(-)
MVVISVSICTRAGKPLIARQFIDIGRSKIEGLLAAFPKLISSDKQHTYVETDSVRYVYQPLDTLYMILITNKASNIMEDLEILQLMTKLVPEFAKSFDESEILENVFELVFAFDEVISLGYREKVGIAQVKTFTEMESYEEKVQEMMAKNREREMSEIVKRRQKKIEEDKLNAKHGNMSSMSSMSSHSSGPTSYSNTSSAPSYYKPNDRPSNLASVPQTQTQSQTQTQAKHGMVLPKNTNKTNEYIKQLEKEGEVVRETIKGSAFATNTSASATPGKNRESIQIIVEEKVNIIMNHDGGLEHMRINGDCRINVVDSAAANSRIKLSYNNNKAIQYKVHPNIDRNAFTKQNILTLKDANKEFPVNLPTSILKWRFETKEESLVPITVNCWPTSPSGGTTTVNMEYELNDNNFELSNLCIAIPIPTGSAPVVNSVDGTTQYDSKSHCLLWKLDLVDASNSNGAMEFILPYNGNSSGFFPINLSFVSMKLFSGITVQEAQLNSNGSAVTFAVESTFSTEQYRIN